MIMKTARKKILVVENDPDIQDITRLVLEKVGHHEVITSCFGVWYQKLNETRPDLILLDYGLRKDATELVCTRLKQRKQTKHLPLMLFSTRLDVGDISRILGADDYITKPFNVESLLEKVERLTSRKQLV